MNVSPGAEVRYVVCTASDWMEHNSKHVA